MVTAAMLAASQIVWEKGYKQAVEKAHATQKPIFFVFTSHHCKWCRQLENTAFKDPEVIETLNRDFINVIAYADGGDDIPRALWSPGTPALWFLDADAKAMFQPIQGAISGPDLLRAVEIIAQELNKRKMKARYGNQSK